MTIPTRIRPCFGAAVAVFKAREHRVGMQNVANFIHYMEDPEFRNRADAFLSSPFANF